ncbi:exopolysaccharide biosynthesis polyprenyl glycosylphosphotransferase [uncultured Shewanella sp.]|uniref:exopolysaccharide biosynthesis polyprenyl glycosylphosphotransferase n=1 Tax=uncultured Shewanella sp. TaxID=173975 RepID=UPI00262E7A44|nr:exopolysaccharide biosynthesis polyprenyl glycosylphosphotransferase [uncultured Shewanella sp.]
MGTEPQPTITQSTRIAIRIIDVMTAFSLLILFSPILIFIWLKRKWRYGQSVEIVYIYGIDNHLIGLYQFSGIGYWRKLPQLFNLLEGEVSLLGTKTYFSFEEAPDLTIKPGLMSYDVMNKSMGIGFESHQDTVNQIYKNIGAYCLAILRTILSYLLLAMMTKHPKQVPPTVTLFDVSLSNMRMVELLDKIITFANTSGPMQHLAFVNADCFNISITHSHYQQTLQQCKHIFADGIGVRIACMWKGAKLIDNLNGTDMFPKLCEQLAQKRLPLFLLGGEPGIAEQTANKMQKKYPELIIAGTQHGFYHLDKSTDNTEIIERINQSGATVLLVAMGVPTQELWLNKYQSQLKVGVGIGVGGLFDFYSGKIKRAPLWVRQLGMEWSYRLLQEPQRMWKRYIIGNPLFLLRAWREMTHIRQSRKLKTKLKRQSSKTKEQSIINLEFNAKQAKIRRLRHHARHRLNLLSKRMLDIIVSSLALLLLSPLLITIALLIRIESSGPVFFSQPRAGKDNKPFTMWKYRSMYTDADERLKTLNNEMKGGVTFKMKQDPRITKIGKIIRKTSIDELPQLWNVLKGDMSLVGPRPALPSEVKQYTQDHRTRLSIKPGITCIWQVSGRSHIPFEQQVELDTDYIYEQSLLADLWLLIKTIPAVILTRGAY